MEAYYPFIALGLCGLFSLLGAVHLFWAIGGQWGLSKAIPQKGGQALFRATFGITLLLGAMFLSFAWMLAAYQGFVQWDVPRAGLRWGLLTTLALFLARMIGEFNYVGVFKRVKGTPFARLDDLLYTPLCGLVAILLALLLKAA